MAVCASRQTLLQLHASKPVRSALPSLQDPAKPVGLHNLGNTCYVNSALQCLFMIPTFRACLYELDAQALPAADQEIVKQLRELFLALQYGPRSSVDPTAFVKCLNLDHSVQQVGMLHSRVCTCSSSSAPCAASPVVCQMQHRA